MLLHRNSNHLASDANERLLRRVQAPSLKGDRERSEHQRDEVPMDKIAKKRKRVPVLYVKVVLGIPVEGPFDYLVPEKFSQKIKLGIRVRVSFRTKEVVAYVVGLTHQSKIKNIKPLLEVIDDSPILDSNMFSLTKQLSEYYCCAWGEAIETALPEGLRSGKKIASIEEPKNVGRGYKPQVTLVHHFDKQARWDMYLKSIQETRDNHQSVIVLLPDINSIFKAKEIINTQLGILPGLLYRKQPQELEIWLKIKEGRVDIVVGTRSAIFAPLNNLGLVIIDEEQDAVYKQDQVPHYHARDIALMRIKIQKAKLILGSSLPSLETFYLVRKNKIKYISLPPKKSFPEIKIIDTHARHYNFRKKSILSKYLEDAIIATLNAEGKILLFLNRKGFATFVHCRYCGGVLVCPRCNINLVYHFKDNILNCHYCNFKMTPPQICPNCNSSYIHYAGAGTEKIESELSRIFAQARIKRLDAQRKMDFKDADIFISTCSIIKETDYNFDLVGVLSIDNSLNRIDFRASERTFALLVNLLNLTEKKLIIQTNFPRHYCLQALENQDINIFYNEELKQRKPLKFPPFQHLGLVKLRGEKEERVRQVSYTLFKRLNRYNQDKIIKIVSINPGQPRKLRGNYYWQILLESNCAEKISKFLKKRLKDFPHSGIIVTIDIDPLSV